MNRTEYGNATGPLGFPMIDRQARLLDQLLKALPREKAFEYRHTVLTKAPTELNPGERSDVSWISAEVVDRQGEVVRSRGMNNTQFAANPLVTLGHAYYLPPVGKSLWQKVTRDGELKGIKAKTQYPARPAAWPESDPWPPDKVFALVQAGMLQGKSIGFLPLKVHAPTDKEITENGWKGCSLVIDEWLLLEYACVFLIVNPKIYGSNPFPRIAQNAPVPYPGPVGRSAWGLPYPARPNAAEIKQNQTQAIPGPYRAPPRIRRGNPPPRRHPADGGRASAERRCRRCKGRVAGACARPTGKRDKNDRR